MVEEKLAKAWADRCGIADDDERATHADECGWLKEFGHFEAGWNAKESAAIECLREFVEAYRAMPDGELGKGLTNGHFLRAERLLSPNAGIHRAAKGRPVE